MLSNKRTDMDFAELKDFLMTKLKEPDFGGFKGTSLSFHIPVEVDTLNEIVKKILPDLDGVNQLVFSDLNENCFTVEIDSRKITRTLRCRIFDIKQNGDFPKLKIEFLDGVRFYEKLAVDTFNKVKNSWMQLKLTFGDNKQKEPEKSNAFWKLTGTGLTVNLNSLLQKVDLEYLVPFIKLVGISAGENKLVVDLKFSL